MREYVCLLNYDANNIAIFVEQANIYIQDAETNNEIYTESYRKDISFSGLSAMMSVL